MTDEEKKKKKKKPIAVGFDTPLFFVRA